MPEFAFVAQDAGGREVKGTLSAPTLRDALALLAGRTLLPVQVTQAAPLKSSRSASAPASFFTQLSDLLRTGVPLLKSLEIIRNQTSNAAWRDVLDDVSARLADGDSLSEAMRARQDAFGALVFGMVQAGEEGGFLEESLRRVATLKDSSDELKSRVRAAIAYPCILLIAGLLIVIGLLVFFVPNFQPIFERLAEQGQLPWATRALIACSELLRQHGLLLCGVALAATMLAVGRLESPGARARWYLWLPRRGFGGAVVAEVSAASFCRVLGSLLGNQVPLLRALRIARDSALATGFAEEIEAAAIRVADGGRLSEVFSRSAYLPVDIAAMVAVGEQSNSLDSVLLDAANTLERRATRRLDLVLKLLEPTLLVMMAAVVLFLVIGLMLPIFDASGALE